jgi:hypothetical protein
MLITSPLVNLKNVKVISVSVKVMTVLPALQTTLVAVIVSIATVRCTCTKMCLWLPKAALISKTIAATMRITAVSSTEISVKVINVTNHVKEINVTNHVKEINVTNLNAKKIIVVLILPIPIKDLPKWNRWLVGNGPGRQTVSL